MAEMSKPHQLNLFPFLSFPFQNISSMWNCHSRDMGKELLTVSCEVQESVGNLNCLGICQSSIINTLSYFMWMFLPSELLNHLLLL